MCEFISADLRAVVSYSLINAQTAFMLWTLTIEAQLKPELITSTPGTLPGRWDTCLQGEHQSFCPLPAWGAGWKERYLRRLRKIQKNSFRILIQDFNILRAKVS